MAGIIALFFFLVSGCLIADRVLKDQPLLIRLWAGMSLGLLAMMWGPVLFGFFFGFKTASHVLSFLLMGFATLIVRRCVVPPPLSLPIKDLPKQLFILIGFFSSLIAALLFLHMLFPWKGSLYAGISAFGDLPMHLGIANSIAEQQIIPPQNPFLAGQRLLYPFLVNSLSSSLLLLGFSLRAAILIPGIIFAFLLVTGFVIFSYEVLSCSRRTILAVTLFFFNGGFGFVYFFDKAKNTPEVLQNLFKGFFTPTTIKEHNIMVWNVICDTLLCQRAALAGYAIFFLALWLGYRALQSGERRYFLLAGLMGGALPMVHTASYLIFLLIMLVWILQYFLLLGKRTSFKNILYLTVLLLALGGPQLMFWTKPQVAQGHFLRIVFNGINEQDLWLWFWIKNAGMVFLLLLPALWAADRARLAFYSPAIVLFVLAEVFLFAPWNADNNKVYHIWLAFSCILVAQYLVTIYDRLQGVRGRGIFAALVLVTALLSGILSVAHDLLLRYQVFSAQDIKVGQFIKKHTPKDALFLSAPFHNNPVFALGGRNVVCGYKGWLTSHGLSWNATCDDIPLMYSDREKFPALREKYGIDYVYFGNWERERGWNDLSFVNAYPVVFSTQGIRVYAVSPRAQARFRSEGVQ